MTDRGEGTYALTHLDQPTTQDVRSALDQAGLNWSDDSFFDRQPHPGLRFTDDALGLVLHPVNFDEATDSIRVAQITMVLGPEDGVVARWSGDRLAGGFADALVTRRDVVMAVVEQVHDVDSEALAALEERVDDCELEVFGAGGLGANAQTIHHLEHELVTLRRAVSPMVSVLDRLGRGDGLADGNGLAEWQERYQRLVSRMEDVDNLLTSVLSVNLTLISVRQNEDMRKIAAWGAIGIAPTAMAGVWGMNFRHMPELEWAWGYPLAVGVIAVVCGSLYGFFKRAGWL